MPALARSELGLNVASTPPGGLNAGHYEAYSSSGRRARPKSRVCPNTETFTVAVPAAMTRSHIYVTIDTETVGNSHTWTFTTTKGVGGATIATCEVLHTTTCNKVGTSTSLTAGDLVAISISATAGTAPTTASVAIGP
jgi:hypothetical protein